jgi:MscS family membrane protein
MIHTPKSHKIACVLAFILFFGIVSANLFSQTVTEKNAEVKLQDISYHPVKTGNPRATIQTFIRLRQELEKVFFSYRKDQTYENAQEIPLLGVQFLELIDLSSVPKTAKYEKGVDTLGYLLDIFGRLDFPQLETIPATVVLENNKLLERWRIPNTPINIIRIEDGPREGEYLFSSRTVTIAPSFYKHIKHIPLKSSLDIEDWSTTFSQMHGPLIPVKLVAEFPDFFKQECFDTPIWKHVAVFLLVVFAIFLLVLWGRLLKTKKIKSKIPKRLRHLIMAVSIIVAFLIVKYIYSHEVNVSGLFAQGCDVVNFIIMNLALVWIFWILILLIFDWIILSPRIPDESLDADLLRLLARIIGFLGCVLIIAYGANDLGLPVVGLFAGLGVGGLAVALAIRPTLENLIGGFILFLDRPVRIGDFCSFGSRMGTIENIGLRSTQVRARDRTLITIPNATFANMEIVNWAKCDQMLILSTIGVRYETEVDQLRFLLVKLREMFLAHPSIDNDTVRVRFVGYGSSSLDIEIRVYAHAREWNGFYAIREDAFLRVKEIVEQSGTSFAFPSQTLYMGQDDGLDKELGEEAVKQVKSWRRSKKLPFPSFSTEKMEELKGTLDYPPKGSIDSDAAEVYVEAEPLSAEPLSAETDEEPKEKQKPESEENKEKAQ